MGDQARLRRLAAGVAGAAAGLRFRPLATGNNKVAWRRSGWRPGSGPRQGCHFLPAFALTMMRDPAVLHCDPITRPRPHRLALVAIPGASEWVSRVSSLATNRPDSLLEKGAGNLASWPAASQLSFHSICQRPGQVSRANLTGERRRMARRPYDDP